MSSELLIDAQKIEKVFISPTNPAARLLRALFGERIKTNDITVLRGVDFKVARGERVGILGRNGAGKTTLLSILGGVSKPTKGDIKRSGKAAVLLGTSGAFNQELTGRENAALYVRLQGYQGQDASSRVAMVEAFAELGRYFDMPIRTYSSGMLSRLSFGCAAHVEADLIILDEALAVGDAEFRMKCYSVMEQRATQGQSYILVSHNPNIIANFCTRGIVMDKGQILFDGAPRDATDFYKEQVIDARRLKAASRKATLDLDSDEIPANGAQITGLSINFRTDAEGAIGEITLAIRCVDAVLRPKFNIAIRNHHGIALTSFRSGVEAPELAPFAAGESRTITVKFRDILRGGDYSLRVYFAEGGEDNQETPLCYLDNVVPFNVTRASGGGLVDLSIPTDMPAPASPASLARAETL